MTVRELMAALKDMNKDAQVVAGHLNITGHLDTVENVGTSKVMSFVDGEKKTVVILDLSEETYNEDEDHDEIEWVYV